MPASRSAVATFSWAESSGQRLSAWKTRATRLARYSASAVSPICARDDRRALAAARGADYRNHLLALDPQIEASQGHRPGRARPVDAEDVVELERSPIDAVGVALRFDPEAVYSHRKLSIIIR
jgi:hypothetical protein